MLGDRDLQKSYSWYFTLILTEIIHHPNFLFIPKFVFQKCNSWWIHKILIESLLFDHRLSVLAIPVTLCEQTIPKFHLSRVDTSVCRLWHHTHARAHTHTLTHTHKHVGDFLVLGMYFIYLPWKQDWTSQIIKWTSELQIEGLNIGVFTERLQTSWTLRKKKKKAGKTLNPLVNSDTLWKGKSSGKCNRNIKNKKSLTWDTRTRGHLMLWPAKKFKHFVSRIPANPHTHFYKAGPRHSRARCGYAVYLPLSYFTGAGKVVIRLAQEPWQRMDL